MKKSSAILLATALLMTGCGQSSQQTNQPSESTQPVDALAEERAAAKSEVNGYVVLENYSEENQATILAAQSIANTAIDAANTQEEIDAAVNEYKTTVDALKTLAQELEEYKTLKVAEVESYADLTLYSDAGKAAISTLINTAKSAIEAAATKTAVDEAVTTFKSNVDAVPNAAQEALALAKEEAIDELNNYLEDLTLYSDANKEVIQRIINDAIESINDASTIDIVEVILEDAEADLDDVKTIEEELAELATKFHEQLVVTAGSADDITVSDKSVIFDTKKANNSTIAKIGSQNDNNCAVLDVYLTPHYNSTDWDSFSIYFRAWDLNANYQLKFTDKKIEMYKNHWDGARVSQTYMVNDTGFANGVEHHVEILARGWTKAVLVDGVCLFKIEESSSCTGSIMFETWETGLELRLPQYFEYASEAEFDASVYFESVWAECVNISEEEKLANHKVEAKNTLDAYITDLTVYSPDNQALIASTIEAAKASIDAATSIADVNTIVNQCKADLDAIPNIEQEALVNAMTAAKERLAAVNLKNYTTDDQASIQAIIDEAIGLINNATTEAAIEDALYDALEEIALFTTSTEKFYTNNISVPDSKLSYANGVITCDSKAASVSSETTIGDRVTDLYFEFDITPHYNNTDWDNFTIMFGAWDGNSGYEVNIYNGKIDIGRVSWTDTGRTVTPYKSITNYGASNDKSNHLLLVTHGWQKALFLNDKCLCCFNESDNSNGYVYLKTWEAGYELTNVQYEPFASDAAFEEKHGNSIYWATEYDFGA